MYRRASYITQRTLRTSSVCPGVVRPVTQSVTQPRDENQTQLDEEAGQENHQTWQEEGEDRSVGPQKNQEQNRI